MVVFLLFVVGALAQESSERMGEAITLTKDEIRRHTRVIHPQFTPGVAGAVDGFAVDTQDRTDVLVFFHQIYLASEGYENRIEWTGNYQTCDAGAVAADFLEDTRRRINYFRAMAGLPANISFNAAKSAKAQEAALIMSVNNGLSHDPIQDFPGGFCLTADGDEAAGMSNIAFGSFGAGAVDGYIRDDGANNAVVGHRRWLLFPSAVEMGSGSVPGSETLLAPGETTLLRSANAIWVIGDFETRPVTPEFVSWPPQGYVPYSLVYPRWSFSMEGADFSGASVSMSTGGMNVSLFVESFGSGAGDATIVWQPSGVPTTPPASDLTYSVTLDNVMVGGESLDFSYDVILMDPFDLGDTVTLTGPSAPFVGMNNSYSFNTISQATKYQLRAAEIAGDAWLEGAEDSPAPRFIDGTTGGYEVRSSVLPRSGDKAFYMAFKTLDDGDQTVTVNRDVIPTAASEFEFFSRFRFVSTTSRIFAEVSLDSGNRWIELAMRNGNGSGMSQDWEPESVQTVVSLSAFAGQTVRVRVRYAADPFTGRFVGADGFDGVYVDDIRVTHAQELINQAFTDLVGGSTSVNFTPSVAGEYILQAQAEVGGRFFGFGPALIVNAQTAPPSIHIDTIEILGGTTVQIDFSLMNGAAGSFQLLRTMDPGGVYSADGMASFQTMVLDSKYRATAPSGSGPSFFRLRMD